MRINRFLAQAEIGSRRKVENLILSGRIKVNGETVDSLSTKVDPIIDEVFLDGKKVDLVIQNPILIALFKPSGYLTSHSDQYHDKTVFHLLPSNFNHFKFAGRLDLSSRGLLLFSNSGEWIQILSHPSLSPEKEYFVELEKPIESSSVEREFRLGIRDSGETLRAKSVEPKVGYSSKFQIVLQEGKKRQIRRMFQKLNGRVKDLIRTRIGLLRLTDLKLKEGEWCEVDPTMLGINF